MSAPALPKVLAFDVFGTVVDWRTSVTRESAAFLAAIGRGDVAAAELHIAAAARLAAASPILEVVLRARLLDYQGRPAEAIALLEKARQSGRTDAPIASQLAMIQERIRQEEEDAVRVEVVNIATMSK